MFKPESKTRIEKLLCWIGVPVHMKGFHMMRNMILCMYDNSKTVGEAYEITAQIDLEDGFYADKKTVERNLRNVIVKTFASSYGKEKRKEIFMGNDSNRISNKEFLSYIIMYLKQQDRVS